jgi:hypothetical protein
MKKHAELATLLVKLAVVLHLINVIVVQRMLTITEYMIQQIINVFVTIDIMIMKPIYNVKVVI